MTLDQIADILTAVFLILGAFLSFAAGVGLLRFSDAIARMHATTKPQIMGLIFVLMGIALQQRRLSIILILGTLMVFQMMTAPISAHMIGRAGYRNGIINPDSLLVDELKDAVDKATEEESENAESVDAGSVDAGSVDAGADDERD